MEVQQAEEAPSCRVCWAVEPPRGLADLLLNQPCGCRGHMSRIHLSCLHTWQVQQLTDRPTEDPSLCEVCGQPYNIPEQLWDELVAARGIDAGERQRVRQQQQLVQDPEQLQQLQRQQAQLQRQQLERQLAELEQALQELQALVLQNPALQQQQQQLQQEAAEHRQQLQQALAHLQRLEEQAVQRAGGEEPDEPGGLQALAQLLLFARGGWFLKPFKVWCWLMHSVGPFLDSSELPATEPTRPPLWHRLRPDACVTAGVLGILALSERQQLGSWRAVWQRGYSAWYVRWAALPFALLALCAVVQHRADAGRCAPNAPAHQQPLAATADELAKCSQVLASLSVTFWPSLLSFSWCWLPSAVWAVVRSRLPWLLLKPAAPVRWPTMPAVLEGLRLNDLWQKQIKLDEKHAADANLYLALLQQRPWAMRRFVAALSPSSVPNFGQILSRFLSFFAPSA